MPDKKRYAKIKAEKKVTAKWLKKNLERHETNMVSAVFHLRDQMRELQKKVNNDLQKMTGDYAVFAPWSADELTAVASQQRVIAAMFAAHSKHDSEFEKRVLKRVAGWEALLAKEAAEKSKAIK